jgi:hypothetical protein
MALNFDPNGSYGVFDPSLGGSTQGTSGTGVGGYGLSNAGGTAGAGSYGLSNTSGFDWGSMGSSVTGGLANYFGSEQMNGGYKNASNILGQLQQTAQTGQQLADPFSQYRGAQASYLNNLLTGKASIQTDPGYQFAQNEGQQQVGRAMQARGMGQSGNVMAALQQRGQDVASQQYNNILERLINLSGAGSQNAIAGGKIYGDISTSGITGQASSAVGSGMSKAGGVSGATKVGSALGTAAGMYFGGPAGGAVGGAIGSALGGLF